MDITSDYGQLGPFWWINSNTKVCTFKPGSAPHPALYGIPLAQWGTCGWGEGRSLVLRLA
jgi:hypothetical protein